MSIWSDFKKDMGDLGSSLRQGLDTVLQLPKSRRLRPHHLVNNMKRCNAIIDEYYSDDSPEGTPPKYGTLTKLEVPILEVEDETSVLMRKLGGSAPSRKNKKIMTLNKKRNRLRIKMLREANIRKNSKMDGNSSIEDNNKDSVKKLSQKISKLSKEIKELEDKSVLPVPTAEKGADYYLVELVKAKKKLEHGSYEYELLKRETDAMKDDHPKKKDNQTLLNSLSRLVIFASSFH